MRYLAFVRNARVETVVQPIALEVDFVRYPIVERIVGQVVAVQFSRQIRIVHIIDLGDPREQGLCGRIGFSTSCC